MKKKNSVFAFLCLVILSVCAVLTGCSGTASNQEKNGKLKVVTTLFAAYDFARQVGGDMVEVSLLLKPGAEAHSFEPTPKDIVNIGECDVFVCNGGENEVWVEDMLATIDNPGMIVVKMVDCCEGIEEEELEGMQETGGVLTELFGAGHNHELGDDDSEDEVEWDEHVWMSPKNAMLIAERICEAYCSNDEKHTDAYIALKNEYLEKLEKVDVDIRSQIDKLDDKMLVFADRFPARYFVEAYGLEYRAAFSGCSANTQASAATVAFIIDFVNDRHVKTIYKIELSDGRLAAAVSEETGAGVKTFYTGHNVTLEDFDAGVTYIDLLYRNLNAICGK